MAVNQKNIIKKYIHVLREQRNLNELIPESDELSKGEKRPMPVFIPGVTSEGGRIQHR